MNKKTEKKNIVWHEPDIKRQDREKLNGHKSCILWFTGLSGSGKSTMAHAVEDFLHKQGVRTFVLDGDNVRHGLCNDLGFSNDARTENIRRIGEVGNLLMQAGIITLTAFISPFKKDRHIARDLVAHGEFIEIFCDASLPICEERDVKGMYKKARAGEIKEFTGISSPYEIPDNAELIIDTGNSSIEGCVKLVINYLYENEIIKNS